MNNAIKRPNSIPPKGQSSDAETSVEDPIHVQAKRIVLFNQLAGRVQEDQVQMRLQSLMLMDEMLELDAELYADDRMKAENELADVFVLAVGGIYISGGEYKKLFAGNPLYQTGQYLVSKSLELTHDHSPRASSDNFSFVAQWCVDFALDRGFDLASALKRVNDANFGKFCSLEVAKKTVKKREYNHVYLGIRETGNPDYPYYLASLMENDKTKPKGKIMKPYNFKPVAS